MTKKKTKKRISFLGFVNKFVVYFGIFFFILLSLATLFFTTQITAGPLSIEFAPLAALVGVAVFLTILLLKPIQKFLNAISPPKLAWFVFWWGLIISILWVFIANVLPMWDSADLSYAAAKLNGDNQPMTLSKWGHGGYMEHFPFQTPLTLLILMCMKVAGNNFVILFELLNCFACAFSLFLTVKLTYAYFQKKSAAMVATLFGMLFIPLFLYCTFIYGNIICLPFILLCWYTQKKAIELLETKQKVNRKIVALIIISVICGGISVVLKGSMMVGVLAAALVWFLWGLKQKPTKRKFIYIGIALVAVVFSKLITIPINSFVEHKTLTNLHNGVPSIVWVTMGVGGGLEYTADTTNNDALRDSMNNPGYYDGLVWVSKDETYSTKFMNNLGWEYLGKRLNHYLQNPGLAVSFFTQKLLTEWTEPTFEGLLASNWDAEAPDGYNMAKRDYTPFARSFYYGKANIVLKIIMDIMQSLLAFGALFGLWFIRKKIHIQNLAPILCILGTFVLYIFWENKTQYMFPAYLFMIPFAAYGWVVLSQKISHKIYKKHQNKK